MGDSNRLALLCLASLLATACDDAPSAASTSDGSETGTGETGETDGVETDGRQPDDGCPEGYSPIETQGECEADAHCFEWAGGWCTGRCPEGTDLWIDINAVCTVPECGEDEIYRPAGEDCAQGPGVECAVGGGGGHGRWTCERCEVGWYVDEAATTEDAIACFEGCAEGFDVVYGQDECLADAGCYQLPARNELDNGWCTGACPEGQELVIPDDDLPECVDAA